MLDIKNWQEMHKAIIVAFHMFHAYMITNDQYNFTNFDVSNWLKNPHYIVADLTNLGFKDEKISQFLETIERIHSELTNKSERIDGIKTVPSALAAWLGAQNNEFRF